MLVIVVTGGIGSGKTTAARHFGSKGAAVLDLDEVARDLLEPGRQPYGEVVGVFGEEVLDRDRRIDRAALARAAFSSRESCSRLNRILHPAVLGEVLPRLDELKRLADPPAAAVIEVPLLVEAPEFAEVADVVLTLSADEEVRIARCLTLDMTEEDARARLACQATDEEREALADRTIVNEGSLEQYLAELDRFWDEVVESRAA